MILLALNASDEAVVRTALAAFFALSVIAWLIGKHDHEKDGDYDD